jgi:2-oxoglutarate ferredoxin oxidoreductase subunit alpha
MFNRPVETQVQSINRKFGKKPELAEANIAVFKAGYHYGETAEIFTETIHVKAAQIEPGTYRNVMGNSATAIGLATGAQLANIPLVFCGYPITPASSILHELSHYRAFGVTTFQAEDEIAAVGAAVGAAFAGSLAITGTSGPGVALKSETISLALMAELPLVIVDVQRGGPSTGLPTKPEQSDLLMALYGRHGESPMPVVAASSASDAFDTAIEACRLAIKYMTPVMLLSDGYIATGSEPWKLPDVADLPQLEHRLVTGPNAGDSFLPYLRDPQTMARDWAVPGVPGLEHRIGGLEKEEVTGNVSYNKKNHQLMTDTRAWKIANIANDIPDVSVDDPDGDAAMLVLSWGSVSAAARAGVGRVRAKGHKVAFAKIRHLNPFPNNLQTLLSSYSTVLVPELNNGQLSRVLRAEFLEPVIGYNKVEGAPFWAAEIEAKILELMNG